MDSNNKGPPLLIADPSPLPTDHSASSSELPRAIDFDRREARIAAVESKGSQGERLERLTDGEGVLWTVASDWRGALLDRRGLRFEDWQAEIIKDGPHRTVYRVALADREFYIKRYRARGLRGWFARWIGFTPAAREFARTRELNRRGVPTVRALACGRPGWRSAAGDSYFVAEALANSCTLAAFCRDWLPQVDPSQRGQMRRRLATALARLTAASHDAGVWHDDLHAGNILVRLDAWGSNPIGDDDSPQLVLIDLPGTAIGPPLDWRRSKLSLRVLCAGWRDVASRSERWRFWREYLARRTTLPAIDPRRAAFEVWRDAFEYARDVFRKRDSRALKVNRDFRAARSRDFIARAVGDFSDVELRRVLADPAAPLAANLHRPIKLSHGSIVVEAELPVGGRRAKVAYKRSRVKRWWKSLFAGWRSSRALAAWRIGHALLQRGIATARPLAVCEPRRLSLRSTSYLITEWLEGAENVHLYLWRVARRNAPERRARARQCAASLGRLVGRMHAWNVAHRDLKGCNLVALERETDVDLRLIDLDGVRIARRLSHKKKMRNLARIAASAAAHPWISRADRLRFLRAYLREQPAGGPRWKQIWREVASRASQIEAKFRRQGAAIA